MEDYNDIVSGVRAVVNGLPASKNIFELLRKHECTYMLSKWLPSAAMDLYICYNKLVINERYNVCAPFFDFLNRTGIKYAVMKGAVLSQAAYGNFAIRKSNDIDVFVNGSDVDRIKKCLMNIGFIQGRITPEGIAPFTRTEQIFYMSQSHQMAPFVKKVDSPLVKYVNIDINTSLLWGESRQHINADCMLSNLEDTSICNIPIKKFSTEIEFIALCLHHYKDMNSIYLLYNGSLKLKLFSDIYFYILNNRVNFLRVKGICDKYQIKGIIYYCVYYTNEIFGGLESCLTYFFDTDMHNNINKFGLAEREVKDWGCSFYSRLFRNDFKDYFCTLISESDMLKINYNKLYL